jgi:phage terminase small subunit
MGRKVIPGPGIFVRSDRGLQLRDEKVKRLLHKLRTVCPWLEVSDVPMARRFCELEVLLSQIYAAIRTKGAFKVDGEVRGLVDTHRRLISTQSMLASQLGLTPVSRIAMQTNSRNMDVDIEAALGRMEKVKAVTTDADDQYG